MYFIHVKQKRLETNFRSYLYEETIIHTTHSTSLYKHSNVNDRPHSKLKYNIIALSRRKSLASSKKALTCLVNRNYPNQDHDYRTLL